MPSQNQDLAVPHFDRRFHENCLLPNNSNSIEKVQWHKSVVQKRQTLRILWRNLVFLLFFFFDSEFHVPYVFFSPSNVYVIYLNVKIPSVFFRRKSFHHNFHIENNSFRSCPSPFRRHGTSWYQICERDGMSLDGNLRVRVLGGSSQRISGMISKFPKDRVVPFPTGCII